MPFQKKISLFFVSFDDQNQINGFMIVEYPGPSFFAVGEFLVPFRLSVESDLDLEISSELGRKIGVRRLSTVLGRDRLKIAFDLFYHSLLFLFSPQEGRNVEILDSTTIYAHAFLSRAKIYESLGLTAFTRKGQEFGMAIPARSLYESFVSPIFNAMQAFDLDTLQGDPEAALVIVEKGLLTLPERLRNYNFPARSLKAALLVWLGRLDEAKLLIQELTNQGCSKQIIAKLNIIFEIVSRYHVLTGKDQLLKPLGGWKYKRTQWMVP